MSKLREGSVPVGSDRSSPHDLAGALDSIETLAGACGISRSTASRFFSGRPTSLTVTLKILAELRVTFEDAARPWDAAGAA